MSSTDLSTLHNDSVHLSKAHGAVLTYDSPSVPSPSSSEIVIKNVAVASNPKDWKLSTWGMFEGIEGNDIAGTVIAVGSDVTEFSIGDRVGSFTPMATHDKYGAYQRYTVTPAATSWKLGSASYEEAATLPLAVLTAVLGLFDKARLDLEEPSSSGKPQGDHSKESVLIWGASSSVGSFALQLAKLAGYHTIAIAGRSSALPKRLGADVLLDYTGKSDEQLKEEILAAEKSLGGGSQIVAAYDAVTSETTTGVLVQALSASPALPGGRAKKITTVLPSKLEGEHTSSGTSTVQVLRTMVGDAHTGSEEQKELLSRWIRQVGAWLDQGIFKPNVVKVVPGGLAGVKEGLKLLQDGKVSGEKLVCEYTAQGVRGGCLGSGRESIR
jgi:NADPH:quinone reductase-like Zn-dependent oxidoreductase